MDAEVAFGRRLVQVGFMRRFDADYRRLKAVIDGGTLGAPLLSITRCTATRRCPRASTPPICR